MPFGIRIVNTEEELRGAADTILEQLDQSVLAKRYIERKKINVALLGNGGNVVKSQVVTH